MADLQAYCRHCQIMFSSGIHISGGASVFSKYNLSSCPRCGRMCAIGDGNYSTDRRNDALLHVTNASIETQKLVNIYNDIVRRELEILKTSNPVSFARVEEIAQRVASDDISEKEAASQIAPYLSKEAAAAVTRLGRTGGLRTFFRAAIVAGKLATWAAPVVAAGVTVYDRLYPSPPAQTELHVPLALNITINNNIVVESPDIDNKVSSPRSREQVRRIRQAEKKKMRLTPLPPSRPKNI